MNPAASALPAMSMAPQIASSLVGAGGSLLGSVFGSLFGANQAKKQREWATREREASQQWQEDMWNKNNEYSSAKSQVARLKEAGLSPNLLYGSGTISGSLGGTPSAPSTPSGGSPASYVPMDLTSLQDYFLKKQELRNQEFHNETERMAVEQDAPVKSANARNSNSLAQNNEFFNELNKRMEKFLEINIQDSAYLKVAQRRKHDLENDVYEQTGLQIALQELENLKQTFNEITARTGEAYSQIALNYASAEAQREMAYELASQTRLNYAEAEKVIQETTEVIRQGDINALDKVLHAYDGGIVASALKIWSEKIRLGDDQTTVRGHMILKSQNRDAYESHVRNKMPVRRRK